MSNNKQSSIERFAVELWEQMSMSGDGEVFTNLLNQAKAMHKEEIMNANEDLSTANGEQYYNETYGNESND